MNSFWYRVITKLYFKHYKTIYKIRMEKSMKVQKFENLERGNILRLLIDSFNQDKIEASLCDVLTCL